VTDAAKLIVFDERLPIATEPDPAWTCDARTLAAFVRMQMKRYISDKYTKGRNTLVVYLLDPELENLMAEHGPALDDQKRERVLQAFRNEIGTEEASYAQPAVLTTVELRRAVREFIAGEFPSLPVLCYQELSPDLNIQPIARLSLPTTSLSRSPLAQRAPPRAGPRASVGAPRARGRADPMGSARRADHGGSCSTVPASPPRSGCAGSRTPSRDGRACPETTRPCSGRS